MEATSKEGKELKRKNKNNKSWKESKSRKRLNKFSSVYFWYFVLKKEEKKAAHLHDISIIFNSWNTRVSDWLGRRIPPFDIYRHQHIHTYVKTSRPAVVALRLLLLLHSRRISDCFYCYYQTGREFIFIRIGRLGGSSRSPYESN